VVWAPRFRALDVWPLTKRPSTPSKILSTNMQWRSAILQKNEAPPSLRHWDHNSHVLCSYRAHNCIVITRTQQWILSRVDSIFFQHTNPYCLMSILILSPPPNLIPPIPYYLSPKYFNGTAACFYTRQATRFALSHSTGMLISP
jgi:hypothetical protein